MKLWISAILAVIVGIVAALFLPIGETGQSLLLQYSELALNIGRYIIFPLVFFSMAIAVCKLRREKNLIRTVSYTAVYILGSTVFLVFLGIIITLIFSPTRIPMIVETQTIFNISDQAEMLKTIFPQNMFTVLTGSSNVILPLCFLSFILGIVMFKDREVSEPTFNLFDSVSRILYELNINIIRITPLLLAGLAYGFTLSVKNIPDITMFNDILLILIITSLLILLVIYPIILYFSEKTANPYKTMYSFILPFLAGFVSGDSFFTLSALIWSSKEKLNISRKVGAISLPLSAMFAKAGTALVTSVSFLTILKSYSSLEITLYQIFWVVLFSILISFTLASIPSMGAYTAVYMLSEIYSQARTGHTDSYLLIKPIVPILIGFAVLIDVATSALITVLVSRTTTKK